ncbi:growth arrest-specific protein 1 [Protopterus annectens]|uniref:growth arrest-specific protein 1 n=1 Tax=Protopterus annectens TaxID=7888 RepID=UPI001CFAD098|nr:growth arrest-specific protein 1 [Protopterus annectens]
MASFAGVFRDYGRSISPWVWLLAVYNCFSFFSSVHSRRLVCWQAIVQCHSEVDCSYAYDQYLQACKSVLTGERHRCPSHCISALIQLNHTRHGPALEDCDCLADAECKAAKREIEPCLPRTKVLGCTEARIQCEKDPKCDHSLRSYLRHCSKLFNGMRCTDECRGVIEDMLLVPKAVLLNECVCDGLERPICESVKANMARLCFDTDYSNNPTSSGGYPLDDYFDYEEDINLGDGVDNSRTFSNDIPDSGQTQQICPFVVLALAVSILLVFATDLSS